MFINHSAKEVTAKIVFYGPGLSGKTTGPHVHLEVWRDGELTDPSSFVPRYAETKPHEG